MCCYPDIERLLANTLPAARRLYAFTVPSSRGWRGVIARLEEWLIGAGFRLRHRDRQRLWQVAIYERSAP